MKKILLVLIFILSYTVFQTSAFSEESNIYFIAYVNRLEHKIKSNWTLPHGQTDKTTIVTFKIDRNGNILNANVVDSSTDNEFDQAALTAIYQSAPFETIPESIKDNNITFQYTFNQNLSEIKPVFELTNTNLKSGSTSDIIIRQQQEINETLLINENNKIGSNIKEKKNKPNKKNKEKNIVKSKSTITAKTIGAGALSLLIWPGLGQLVNQGPSEKAGTHAILGFINIFRLWSCYDAVVNRRGGAWEGRI